MIMRNCEIERLGVAVRGNQYQVRYADGKAQMTDSEASLKPMVSKVKQKSEESGLKLKAAKTRTMIVSKNQGKVTITTDGQTLEQFKNMIYLGSTTTEDGRCV